ncbi:sialic acid-binding Ig-like lectin 14 [Gracilinanus agilis]|uniref:sialic acid-binding Ig-like lectin 14 n=1 Tax=Gracilinanus agilis TaxID=191870 RepID=UPI001CFC8427|nr:sialic acid-binding Ig-like lectin 14 [Gracilinanus agilis]
MLGEQTLASSQPSEDGVLSLQLPQLRPADGGRYTCLAQHPLGSKNVSLNVSVQGCSSQGSSSWPLVLTLLRGGLMGAGFLLTYGLTWLYYTRKLGGQERPPCPEASQASV